MFVNGGTTVHHDMKGLCARVPNRTFHPMRIGRIRLTPRKQISSNENSRSVIDSATGKLIASDPSIKEMAALEVRAIWTVPYIQEFTDPALFLCLLAQSCSGVRCGSCLASPISTFRICTTFSSWELFQGLFWLVRTPSLLCCSGPMASSANTTQLTFCTPCCTLLSPHIGMVSGLYRCRSWDVFVCLSCLSTF